MSMALAHMFEYLFVCAFHYKELKWDSFLINHSKSYCIAAIVSWVEFYLELAIMPQELVSGSLAVGFFGILIGHFLRISAMFTAASNFHHIV